MSLLSLPATFHRLVPIRAEVDLDALRHNLGVLRQRAGEAEVMAVVKADAYGHGAVPVARLLAGEGVRRFAVANVPEGVELREAGLEAPILVLAAPLPEYLPAYSRYNLQATVSSEEVADGVVEAARRAGPITVHVKVETGMHRLGIPPEAVAAVLARLADAPGVEVEGLMTHFATVDRQFTQEQMDRFDRLLGDLGDAAPPLAHLSNSGTLLHVPETARGRSLARVGGALFGLVSDRVLLRDAVELRPVMRLVSRVVHLQTVPAGESVSYGRTWKAEGARRVATVAAGYGDGLPRLSNAGTASIDGQSYPVAGRVCMDMMMLDLGEPDGVGATVRVGDEVVLFGPGGPSALQAAQAAQTIPYALTCGLTARVPRVYIGGRTHAVQDLAEGAAVGVNGAP